jgi:hypothetical protein
MMSRSFKRSFAEAISDLLSSVGVTPEPGRTLVSLPLYDAICEIRDEVAKARTNWHLVAALTGTKSYICTVDQGRTIADPFWAEERGDDGPSVYGTLDQLHFRVAMRANVMPSGMTVFVGTPDGIGKQSGEVDTSASPTSPTFRLIARERARIEAGAATVPEE